MLKDKFVLIFIALPMMLYSQDIVIQSDYSIRDFSVKGDSLYYLEHTELYLKDCKNDKTVNSFVGGFGLELYELNDKEILTVANELIENIASFRFYDKKSNKMVESFFYKKGKVLDFIKIPDLNVFAFSTTNKKIVFINFDQRKNLKKIIEIKLNGLSRRLFYRHKELFYCTDNGEVFSFSLINYEKKLIHKTNIVISDFIVIDNILIYSTINGDIVKLDLKSKKVQNIKLENDFILTSLKSHETLVCGSWKGNIYIIDIEEFKILKKLDYHKAPVLKILNQNDSIFYSSSIDKTIKKWIIK